MNKTRMLWGLLACLMMLFAAGRPAAAADLPEALFEAAVADMEKIQSMEFRLHTANRYNLPISTDETIQLLYGDMVKKHLRRITESEDALQSRYSEQ